MVRLAYYLIFLLVCRVAFGGTYRVYNFGPITTSVRVYHDGSYYNSPISNLKSGYSATFVASGNYLLQVGPWSGPLAVPQAGVFPSDAGGVFIIFGTNECVEISRSYSFTNTTAGEKYVYPVVDGEELYNSAYILSPGASWSWSIPLTVCSNGYSSQVSFESKRNYVSMVDDGADFSFTNQTETAVLFESNTNAPFGGMGPSGETIVMSNTPSIVFSQQTNSVINFNGTSSTAARDDTLKAGFNVLAQQLDAINQKVQENTMATLRGGTGPGGTGFDDAGIIGAVGAFHSDNTNLLGQLLGKFEGTNNAAGTNAQAGADAAESVRAQFDGLADGAPSSWDDPGSALDSSWTITVPAGGQSFQVNLNPFSLGWVSDLAALCRRIVTWGVLFLLVWRNTHITIAAIMATGGFRQATSAGTTVLGTNVNSGLALAMAVAITVAVGVIPVALVTWAGATGHLPTIFSSPFTASTSPILQSLYLANQFFPLALMLTASISAWVYQISLGGLLWVSQAIVRFLVG
ncbi:MAG: hypothetical protein M9920_15500 [Verrucomicrobiae bacterium]|nr:hypothetical protein [Verrucomicrobiae bacterium]